MMPAFVCAILAVSALSLASDVLILAWLLSAREKPVRVWGRLGATAYHLAVGAWAACLVAS